VSGFSDTIGQAISVIFPNFKTLVLAREQTKFLTIPLAVIFLFLSKIVEILEKISKPLGLESYFSASLAVIIGLLLLLTVCFFIGVLVRTSIGVWSFERLENKVLKQIPGYGNYVFDGSLLY
jgi:hypothetical protein